MNTSSIPDPNPRLLAERAALLARIAAQRGGTLPRAEVAAQQYTSGREESHAQAMSERDTEFALEEHELAELTAIDAALQRIREGAYGICTDCDAEIAPARLQAVPTALRCMACQSQHEKNH